MGKSLILVALLIGVVYSVNAASIKQESNTWSKVPNAEHPPKFAAVREKRGYGFDEDEHVEEHEHHHSAHDESHSEHHESDYQKHKVHHGHEEHAGHHGHDDYDGHHEHEDEHEYGHHGSEDEHEYEHRGHEHGHKFAHKPTYGVEHGADYGYDHGHDFGHDDDVSVHVGGFNSQKSSHLKEKAQQGYETVKEVKYEVEKTKYNNQHELELNQNEKHSGFTFES